MEVKMITCFIVAVDAGSSDFIPSKDVYFGAMLLDTIGMVFTALFFMDI